MILMDMLSFLKEFLKGGEISPRWASPPNQVTSAPYDDVAVIIRNDHRIHFLYLNKDEAIHPLRNADLTEKGGTL